MTRVAALFVDPKGVYPTLVGAENCWALDRDARTYAGPHPVVAHPPCNLWANMAAQNYARAIAVCPTCEGDPYRTIGATWPCPRCEGAGRREPNRAVVLPAWYPGGDDGGRFAAALRAVRTYGGVLEHPAGSHAWRAHGLREPHRDQWTGFFWTSNPYDMSEYHVCEVWQSAYGHKARKRTWLLYCGKRPPFELRWSRTSGTHQVGWFDRNKPTVGKREASATPEAFARELIRLAIWSRGAP